MFGTPEKNMEFKWSSLNNMIDLFSFSLCSVSLDGGHPTFLDIWENTYNDIEMIAVLHEECGKSGIFNFQMDHFGECVSWASSHLHYVHAHDYDVFWLWRLGLVVTIASCNRWPTAKPLMKMIPNDSI